MSGAAARARGSTSTARPRPPRPWAGRTRRRMTASHGRAAHRWTRAGQGSASRSASLRAQRGRWSWRRGYGATVGPVPESNTGWDAQLTGSGSGPEFTAAFRSAIERTCQDFCAHHDPLLAPLGGDARRLGDAARRSVSGGKRFRATFGWWGHHAAAGTAAVDSTALLRACAALEFLHASALVHDDYIDASDVRRGRPASHRAFA